MGPLCGESGQPSMGTGKIPSTSRSLQSLRFPYGDAVGVPLLAGRYSPRPEHLVLNHEVKRYQSALFIRFLILSGDIEINSEPTYMCSTCRRPYRRRMWAIQCFSCGAWTHHNKHCSGVRQHETIPPRWQYITFHPTHMTQLPTFFLRVPPLPASPLPGLDTGRISGYSPASALPILRASPVARAQVLANDPSCISLFFHLRICFPRL